MAGNFLAAEMRWKGPAVQAAELLAPATLAWRTLTPACGSNACQRRPQRVWFSTEGLVLRRVKRSTSGDLRGASLINTARGTPWDLADLRRDLPEALQRAKAGTIGFGMPRCREANEARGSIRTRTGVPRALGFNSRRRHQKLQAAPGA